MLRQMRYFYLSELDLTPIKRGVKNVGDWAKSRGLLKGGCGSIWKNFGQETFVQLKKNFKFFFPSYRPIFLRAIGLSVTLAFLLLGFQNCTRTSLLSTDGFTSVTLSNIDNGTPYDGKPVDQYARWMRGFSCDGKPSPTAKIELRDKVKVYVENTSLQCAWRSKEITASEIERSAFQNMIWGFQEGIFEADLSKTSNVSIQTQIPANLVEVWCNNSQSQEASEVIVYYDESTKLAKVQLYAALDGNSGTLASKEVGRLSRLVSTDTVDVSSSESDLRLTVHRDQINANQPGLFPSEVRFSLNGVGLKSYSTFCRLGGSLDTKLWPAKQIVDVDVNEVVEAPNKSEFVYKYSRNDLSMGLGWGNIQEAVTQPLAIQSKARGISYVDFTDDSKSLVFTADMKTDYITELFKVSVLGLRNEVETPLRLSSPLVDPNQSVEYDAKIVRGANLVLYRDGSQETTNDIEKWLRSVSLISGEIHQVNKPFTAFDEEVQYFTFSNTLQKSIYLGGSTHPRLYTVNADGSGHKDITPTLASGQFLRFGQRPELFGEQKYLQIETYFYKNYDSQVIVLNLENGQRYLAPKNHLLRLFDVKSKRGVIVDSLNQAVKFYNFASGASAPISTSEFLDNGEKELPTSAMMLVQKTNSSPGLTDAELHALKIGEFAQVRVCGNLVADQFLLDTKEGSLKWVVTAIDSIRRTAQIAELDSSLNCTIKNSVNLTNVNFSIEKVQQVVVSPDSKKVLIAISDKPASRYVAPITKKILYAPLNGQAPLQVNAGLTESGDITNFTWSNDSSSIFFFGSYRNQSEKRGYLWRVPQ